MVVNRRGSSLLLVLSVVIGIFLKQNPLLVGIKVGKDDWPSDDIFRVYNEHPVLDAILTRHKDEIGDDIEGYRNHCLRVLSFAVAFLDGDNGGTAEVGRRPSEREIELAAVAVAYHDIALWSDGKLDYLDPSAAVMKREQAEQPVESEDDVIPKLDAAELETADEAILQHHKWTSWSAPKTESGGDSRQDQVNANLVNAIRMADWADFSVGILRSGLPASYVEKALTLVPEAGFHMILAGMGARLSPDSFVGQLAVMNIFKL